MSITGSLIIFVLIWWIIFFSLLPIDVDRKHKEMVEGVDKGSPENPKIIKKIIHQIKTKIMSEPVILILNIN